MTRAHTAILATLEATLAAELSSVLRGITSYEEGREPYDARAFLVGDFHGFIYGACRVARSLIGDERHGDNWRALDQVDALREAYLAVREQMSSAVSGYWPDYRFKVYGPTRANFVEEEYNGTVNQGGDHA